MRFSTPSKNDFLAPFGRPVVPKSRRIEFFGPFLAPPWILRDPQNRPKSNFNIKNRQKKQMPQSIFSTQFPRSLSDRSWAPFWSILDGFWKVFAWFFMKFGCIFAAKCADPNRFMRSDSASCIATFCVLPFVCCHSFCKLLVAFNLPFSKSTEKVKNMQRNSEICKWRAYPRTQTSNVD